MPAAESSGGAPAEPSGDGSDPTAEPFLLESLLAEVRSARFQARQLAEESALQAALHPVPEWQHLHREVTGALQRAERTLLAAAVRDGLPLNALEPDSAAERAERDADEDPLGRVRRLAREVEHHCTSVTGQAAELGLTHLAHALGRWSRELIGLEQPLIRANARRCNDSGRNAGR
jgi:hypothetical protein